MDTNVTIERPKRGRAAAAAPGDPDLLPSIKTRGRGRPRTSAFAAEFPKHRIARLETLVPHPDNPRIHSPTQISKLVASIKEFGFTNPVLIDEKRVVMAGHGRLLAAQKMKMEAVPVIELRGLTNDQKRALMVADNRLPMDAGWDEEKLADILGGLREGGFTLGLTGFDGRELTALFGEGTEGLGLRSGDPEAEDKVTCPNCGHAFAAQ